MRTVISEPLTRMNGFGLVFFNIIVNQFLLPMVAFLTFFALKKWWQLDCPSGLWYEPNDGS